jgi:hypothetical protein
VILVYSVPVMAAAVAAVITVVDRVGPEDRGDRLGVAEVAAEYVAVVDNRRQPPDQVAQGLRESLGFGHGKPGVLWIQIGIIGPFFTMVFAL